MDRHNVPEQPRRRLAVVPDVISDTEQLEELTDYFSDIRLSTSFSKRPELLASETIPEGYRETFGHIDKSGYARVTDVYIPERQTTEVPIVATTAWTTSNRGHNEHTARRLVRGGSPVIVQGAEGSYRPPISERKIPNRSISLARSAGALLTMSEFIASEHGGIIDAEKRILIGESRGGMVGMGVLALSEYFNQNVVYADLTAPCFPRKMEREDIRRFSEQFINEPKTFLRLAGKIALRQLIHYPSTIDLHPYSIAHQAGIGPALFSGEAGGLARLVDGNPIVHITCFDDDFASMPDEWRAIFNGSNARITPLEGSHLSIADPETLRYIQARNQAYHTLNAQTDSDISGDALFDLAHKIFNESEAEAA